MLKELNSEVEKTNLQLSKSQELIKKKQYDEAKKLLLQIKKVHQEYGSDRYLVETYKKLTWIYLHQNNKDSTAYYFNKDTILKDEKLNATVLKQTSELETKYQTVQKEKLLLKKEVENKAKTNTIAGLSMLAIFITIISVLLYRQQTLKNTQQKQEFDLKEAIAHIVTQNKLQDQRLAISRDLHDNIGSQLTFIISSVENLKFGFPNIDSAIKNHLTKISDFTKTTMVELRDTIWAMNSQEKSFDDLSARIYNFIEKAQSVKQNIVFKLDISTELKQTKLSSLQGINLYRTIQEATKTTANASVTPGQMGGLGAIAGAILGGGSSSIKGALGGGVLGMLGTLAVNARQNKLNIHPSALASGDLEKVLDKNQIETMRSENTEKLMLRAMINAAKADGQLDDQEMDKIMGKVGADGITAEEQNFLRSEIDKPLNIQKLVADVPNPLVAAQVYAVSLFAIDINTDAERQYLKQLAQALGL